MAMRGVALVAWRFPTLHTLRCLPSRSAPLLPPFAHAIHPAGPFRRTFFNASSLYWLNRQCLAPTIRCQRYFCARPSSQDKASSEMKPRASSTNDDEKTFSFRSIIGNFAAVPMVPMILGVGGAIPFLALTPPFPYLLPLPEVVANNPIEAQAMYGAVILSFLGAPHWGLAMVGIQAPTSKIFNYASNSVRYVWSIVPSLLAWPALLMTTVPKLQLLICSFSLVLIVDIIFAGSGLVPLWYLPLRVLLSGIVILCLSTSLLEVLIAQKLENQKTKSTGN